MDESIRPVLDEHPIEAIVQYLADRTRCDVEIKLRAGPQAAPEHPQHNPIPDSVAEFNKMAITTDVDPYENVQLVQEKPEPYDVVAEAMNSAIPEETQAATMQVQPQYKPAPVEEPQPVEQPVEQPQQMPPPPAQEPAFNPNNPLEVVKAHQHIVASADNGTLMRIAQAGGFDPDPMVRASQAYDFMGINLGNTDKSHHAYLVSAAAYAVFQNPMLRGQFGLG